MDSPAIGPEGERRRGSVGGVGVGGDGCRDSGREPARDIAWPVSCQLGSSYLGEKACVYRAVVKTENQAATV